MYRIWSDDQMSRILAGIEDEKEKERIQFMNNPYNGYYLLEAVRETYILTSGKIPIRLNPDFATQRAADLQAATLNKSNMKQLDANRVFGEMNAALIKDFEALKGNPYYQMYINGDRVNAFVNSVTSVDQGDLNANLFLTVIADQLPETDLKNTINLYLRDRSDLVVKFIGFLRSPSRNANIRRKGDNLWALFSTNQWKLNQ